MRYLEARSDAGSARWPLSGERSVIGRGGDADIHIDHRSVSSPHARLDLDAERVEVLDLGSRYGTWVGGERVRSAALGLGEAFRIGRVSVAVKPESRSALVFPAPPDDAVARLGHAGCPGESEPTRFPAPAAKRRERPEALLVASASMRALCAQLERVAPTELPVLFVGETGSGKEVLTRYLHDCSGRRSGPLVCVNCAALPEALVEAELFGIERGVATGVDARPGRFASASGGTLLLDEVGDLPLALQPKLLRALDSGVVERLGATQSRRVDVRIVAATHCDLEELVAAGSFREDLYHRLAGFEVRVPALRERREEILPLARRFLDEASVRLEGARLALSEEAERALVGYAWPGNVRELRLAMLRAAALADEGLIALADLPPRVSPVEWTSSVQQGPSFEGSYREAKAACDRAYFARLLERSGGNLSRAARLAGISRSRLYEKLDEAGLR